MWLTSSMNHSMDQENKTKKGKIWSCGDDGNINVIDTETKKLVFSFSPHHKKMVKHLLLVNHPPGERVKIGIRVRIRGEIERDKEDDEEDNGPDAFPGIRRRPSNCPPFVSPPSSPSSTSAPFSSSPPSLASSMGSMIPSFASSLGQSKPPFPPSEPDLAISPSKGENETNGFSVWSLSPETGEIGIWSGTNYANDTYLNIENNPNCMVQCGNTIWIGGYGNIVVYDSHGDQQVHEIKQAHQDLINALVVVDKDGGQIWSASNDRCIKIWKAKDYSQLRVLRVHRSRVNCLLSLGPHVWSGSFDKSVVIFDAQTHQPIQDVEQHQDSVRALEVGLSTTGDEDASPYVFSGGFDGMIYVWAYSSAYYENELKREFSLVEEKAKRVLKENHIKQLKELGTQTKIKIAPL
eukprot:CAMPEP_0201537916 /NCGR_PEP_ID=MMETSP0161_2-20130828/66156_1 /ASSEMBLY_ACC=CAM_ASM_000251 /TAXON_ID=180227 /ORGANISM="Neoparamoeba aestuarina, Strain SoJaBio B1-5/56/2" /LENGTH=406 /DNA_ID=CAMNT_0047944483 /DNA_START=1 /DNA_END=1221 /DNA_ORIENTATION=-